MSKTKAPEKPTTKSVELREPQVRILKALAKEGKPLSRGQIASKAKVDRAWLTEYIGSTNPEIRKKNDAKVVSLWTLGFIRLVDGDGFDFYQITDKGRSRERRCRMSTENTTPEKKTPTTRHATVLAPGMEQPTGRVQVYKTGVIIHVKARNKPNDWAEVVLTKADLDWIREAVAAELAKGEPPPCTT